jgi:hypothetical protein
VVPPGPAQAWPAASSIHSTASGTCSGASTTPCSSESGSWNRYTRTLLASLRETSTSFIDSIGEDGGASGEGSAERDARALHEKLDRALLPCSLEQRERYLEVMRRAIALNASFFNTQRMLLQYLYAAYVEHGVDCR